MWLDLFLVYPRMFTYKVHMSPTLRHTESIEMTVVQDLESSTVQFEALRSSEVINHRSLAIVQDDRTVLVCGGGSKAGIDCNAAWLPTSRRRMQKWLWSVFCGLDRTDCLMWKNAIHTQRCLEHGALVMTMTFHSSDGKNLFQSNLFGWHRNAWKYTQFPEANEA